MHVSTLLLHFYLRLMYNAQTRSELHELRHLLKDLARKTVDLEVCLNSIWTPTANKLLRSSSPANLLCLLVVVMTANLACQSIQRATRLANQAAPLHQPQQVILPYPQSKKPNHSKNPLECNTGKKCLHPTYLFPTLLHQRIHLNQLTTLIVECK